MNKTERFFWVVEGDAKHMAKFVELVYDCENVKVENMVSSYMNNDIFRYMFSVSGQEKDMERIFSDMILSFDNDNFVGYMSA